MAVFINSHFYSISFVNKLYWKSIEHDGASGSSRGSGGAGGRGRNGLSSEDEDEDEDEDERRRRIRWEREGLGENCGYFFGKNKDGGKDGKPRGGTPSAPDLSDPPNSGARPKVRSGGSTSPQSSLRRGTGGDPPQSFPHIGGYNADLKTLRQSIQTLRENARKRRGESDEQMLLQVQVVDLMKIS
ncbi:signal peptide-containing protein [Cryptosporidium parvum]